MPRCTRYAPATKCDARREAQVRGEMYFSERHHGWIFPADDRQPPRELRARWVAPIPWTFCPFCGGALPDEVSAIERALYQEPDDGC